MRKKLIAMGNVLMGDDGIAVAVAKVLEQELHRMEIEVILGETDIGCCILSVQEEDYIILLDAARMNKQPGEITIIPFLEYQWELYQHYQHDICLPELLGLYLHQFDGLFIAVEIAQTGFGYGISPQLQEKVQDIAKNILDIIKGLP